MRSDRPLILAIGGVDGAKQFLEKRLFVDGIHSGEILTEDLEVARREKADGDDPLVWHTTSVNKLSQQLTRDDGCRAIRFGGGVSEELRQLHDLKRTSGTPLRAKRC